MPIRIVRAPREMQAAGLARSAEGVRVALVPTMGALHEGHLALIRRARELADEVVVSIFVNPAQFGPTEDFDRYPRTFEADVAGCEAAGADVVFAPTRDALYPEGYQTYVEVENLQRPLCGTFRPVFFRGVATVVLKLFNIVRPASAVFGWKDAQQFLLLQRMVRDLDVPVEMVGVETVREPDGLAMSSRNAYLTPDARAVAPAIHRGLTRARDAALAGERDAAKVLAEARAEIEAAPGFAIQYLEAVSMETLEPLREIALGETLVAVAAHLGETRLIDNLRF